MCCTCTIVKERWYSLCFPVGVFCYYTLSSRGAFTKTLQYKIRALIYHINSTNRSSGFIKTVIETGTYTLSLRARYLVRPPPRGLQLRYAQGGRTPLVWGLQATIQLHTEVADSTHEFCAKHGRDCPVSYRRRLRHHTESGVKKQQQQPSTLPS